MMRKERSLRLVGSILVWLARQEYYEPDFKWLILSKYCVEILGKPLGCPAVSPCLIQNRLV